MSYFVNIRLASDGSLLCRVENPTEESVAKARAMFREPWRKWLDGEVEIPEGVVFPPAMKRWLPVQSVQ